MPQSEQVRLNETKLNKTKDFDLRQAYSVLYQHGRGCGTPASVKQRFKILLLFLFTASALPAQERKVDPTWLHRVIPLSNSRDIKVMPGTCQYKPIFGEGDSDQHLLRTVTRFGELSVGENARCPAENGGREEQIYFLLAGTAVLDYAGKAFPMRSNDFTYVAPGVPHGIEGSSQTALVLIMSFKIPSRIAIGERPTRPSIVNLADVKEETVDGHPSSVLYKLLIGSRAATRDAIDQAYIVTSFFWMDFAPAGTNFPHHHEGAEEIYLVMDGRGQMVAGSGMDGIEGKYLATSGDTYYFRPNCTVGFYNQNKPDAKAHILAVRARIPPPEEDD